MSLFSTARGAWLELLKRMNGSRHLEGGGIGTRRGAAALNRGAAVRISRLLENPKNRTFEIPF